MVWRLPTMGFPNEEETPRRLDATLSHCGRFEARKPTTHRYGGQKAGYRGRDHHLSGALMDSRDNEALCSAFYGQPRGVG